MSISQSDIITDVSSIKMGRDETRKLLFSTKNLETNKPMYDYNLYVQKELELVCKPLKEYFLLNFGYMRIYNDNNYFLLNDDINFVEKFALSLEKDTIFCEKFIGDLKNKHRFLYTLWPESPTDHPSMQTHFNAGYWSGMDVFLKEKDYLDLWWFSRSRADPAYTTNCEFFIRNIEVLTEFILYFNQYASKLLANFNDKNLALATLSKGFDFATAEFVPEEYYKLSAFLEEISNSGMCIKGLNKVVILSHREIECLKCISLGMTMKQVARKLNISHRTVESHIHRIKTKSGFQSRHDLVKLFQDKILSQ